MKEINIKEMFAGLYLAKFEKEGIKQLGFTTFKDAFSSLANCIGGNKNSIRLYRDEFSPAFPDNQRKGWHKRKMNPVVIRRILGMLKKAGLVKTTLGRKGAELLKRPEEITLLDVYRAVGADEGTVLDVHTETNPFCPVGANIQTALGGTVHAVQALLEAELSTRTVADIVSGIRQRMK